MRSSEAMALAVRHSPMSSAFELTINGKATRVAADADATLLDVLRNELGLTGAKRACDGGTCGACTVLVDDRRLYACIALAALQDGKRAFGKRLSIVEPPEALVNRSKRQ